MQHALGPGGGGIRPPHHHPHHHPGQHESLQGRLGDLSRSLQQLQGHAQRAIGLGLSSCGRGVLLQRGSQLAVIAAAAAAAVPPPEGSNNNSRSNGTGDVSRQKRSSPEDGFGSPRRRATDTFIVINIICFALQYLTKGNLTYLGVKINDLISAGQWWRLITPAFLHSGVLHLALNTVSLHNLAPQVEMLSGGQRLTAIYLVSAVASTTASYLFCPAPSLGASGAVFGIGAALGIFFWRHRDILGSASDNALKSLGTSVAINVAYAVFARNIDNWGHFGGMLGGAVVALLLGPKFMHLPDGQLVDQPPLPWLAHKFKGKGAALRSRDGGDRVSQQTAGQAASVAGAQSKGKGDRKVSKGGESRSRLSRLAWWSRGAKAEAKQESGADTK